MLAAHVEDVEALRFPLLASPKLDGIRAFVSGGRLLSRTLKPIPNLYTQWKYSHLEYHDGELIVGPDNAPDVYRKTMSGVMSRDGKPEVVFRVFDHVENLQQSYLARQRKITRGYELDQTEIRSADDLMHYELKVLSTGYEGVMLRAMDAPYKCGRSTLSEQYLMKLKRFLDDEAVVIGFEEKMHNANEAKTNALGYMERSSHQANLVPTGMLGALVVQWRGLEFNIGTGFTDKERYDIWESKEVYRLKWVKFKYLPVGVKDKPRHPVFLGWRDKEDM